MRCRGALVRLVVVSAVVAVCLLGSAGVASAHPLGNFTVNRYARVEVSGGTVRVHYVLDEAEIPAFQERTELASGKAEFATRRAKEIAENLHLVVDGERAELEVTGRLLTEPPGQGGLSTLRLAITYTAALPGEQAPDQLRRASFRDDNQPDRIGWREILVVGRGDAEIMESTAPARDSSDELRNYPDDLLQAPLDRRSATFSFTPGRAEVPPSPLTGRVVNGGDGGFASLVSRSQAGGLAFAGALAVAVGFGALHALAPGHGKTIMAAYLVGTRGRRRDAMALGTIVSLMHTASVLLLALVLVRIDRSVAAEQVYPWLTLLSGVVVTGVGLWLLTRRWRSRTLRSTGPMSDHQGHDHDHDHGHGHDHDHDDHDHDDHDHDDHDHGHGHGEKGHADHGAVGHSHRSGGHSHALPSDVSPLSRRGLVALGASGGLFPSPSAVVVLISTFSLDRAGLGLALVAAFSLGLAVTLTAVGLALVYGRGLAERRGPRLALDVLPVAGAAALVLIGLVVMGQGISAV